MFITVSARELNPHCRVISRAESLDASRKLERAGAALVVSPHKMAGKTIATALLHPRLARMLNGGDGGEKRYFELGEVVIHATSEVVGKTIAEVGGELLGLSFVAIERPDGDLIVQPTGDERFVAGDVLIFAGAGDVVQRMRHAAASSKRAQPALA